MVLTDYSDYTSGCSHDVMSTTTRKLKQTATTSNIKHSFLLSDGVNVSEL